MTDDLYQGIDNLEVLTEAARYNRFLVDAVFRASGGGNEAVDFGAGTGTFSDAARERGLRVTCVEPDPRLRRLLRDRGFEAYAELEALAGESQEFIYTLNVLEHIEDDGRCLETLFLKLRPGGRLLVYVPAFEVLFSSMDKKIGHFRRYDKAGLVRIARRVGFVIERAEYADSLGFFVTLLYKIFGSRKGDVSPSTLRFYDRLIFPVSRALDRIGFSRLFGKNLMVVLRRPEI
jgi:SAM-dependent methyltransferase